MIAGLLITIVLAVAVGAGLLGSGLVSAPIAVMAGACTFATCLGLILFWKLRRMAGNMGREQADLEAYERDISKRISRLESHANVVGADPVKGKAGEESRDAAIQRLDKRLWSIEQSIIAMGEKPLQQHETSGPETNGPDNGDTEQKVVREEYNIIKLDEAAKARNRSGTNKQPANAKPATGSFQSGGNAPQFGGNAPGNGLSKIPPYQCPDGEINVFPVLQPVISLPEEDVLFYEAFARTQNPNGDLVEAQHFIPELEKLGRVGEVDISMLRNMTGILRRMIRENGEPSSDQNPSNTGLFWNLSHASLAKKRLATQLCEILEANAPHSGQIIPELRIGDLANTTGNTSRVLDQIAGYGYRFSLEANEKAMEHLDAGPDGFAKPEQFAASLISMAETYPVSYLKVTAKDLLKHCGDGAERLVDVLVPRLETLNIMLIATHVETENQVLSLIDHHVGGAQGHFICPPRPVKPSSSGQSAIGAN